MWYTYMQYKQYYLTCAYVLNYKLQLKAININIMYLVRKLSITRKSINLAQQLLAITVFIIVTVFTATTSTTVTIRIILVTFAMASLSFGLFST